MDHARLAAKHLHIDELPLVVPPHPIHDLTPEQLRELARAAYPLIIEQLTGQGPLAPVALVDFAHPAARNSRQEEQSGGEETR